VCKSLFVKSRVAVVGKQDARRDVKQRVALGDSANLRARGDVLARQQAQRARVRAQQALFFFFRAAGV
jgi:hypothetical protein